MATSPTFLKKARQGGYYACLLQDRDATTAYGVTSFPFLFTCQGCVFRNAPSPITTDVAIFPASGSLRVTSLTFAVSAKVPVFASNFRGRLIPEGWSSNFHFGPLLSSQPTPAGTVSWVISPSPS